MEKSQPDLLLDRADQAMSRQSWREAWALLEQVNPEYYSSSLHLGARRQDFMLMAASCLRHRGQLDASIRLYDDLSSELSLNDPRLAEAIMGKAETLHAKNKFGDAIQLLRAAEKVPGQSEELQMRIATTKAHVFSHVEIPKSLSLFEQAVRRFKEQDAKLISNLLFFYGDALLVAGEFEEAEQKLGAAREIAQQEGCAVTVADCMRRLPLVHLLRSDTTRSLSDLADMSNAAELYRSSGDRGEVYLHTEHGELLRSMGRTREAEAEFNRGLWASREIGDRSRQGHNLLGLFEVSRQGGKVKPDLLDAAELEYDKSRSDWGRLHTIISRALADASRREELTEEGLHLAEESSFSDFSGEKELLTWIRSASLSELNQEPHLMNYP